MAQMAHFSFPYYFPIPNSEFRILKSEFGTTNFGIRNCDVYVMRASGNSLSTLEGILNFLGATCYYVCVYVRCCSVFECFYFNSSVCPIRLFLQW